MGLVLLGVPLIVLMAVLTALGMSALQHSNSTGLVGWLTKTLANVPLIGGLSVQQILKLDAWITHYLGSHFRAIEGRAVGWFAGLSTYVKVMALAPMNAAATSWAFGWWLVHTEIPRIARAHTKHAEQTATHADAVAEAALKRSAGLAKSHPGKVTQVEITRIEKVAMPHAGEWSWIHNHWKALTQAITAPTTLPGIIAAPRVADIAGWTRRNLRWHTRRIARLETLLGAAGLTAVLARVLGVTSRCLRSGNLGRTARRVCGMDTGLLDELLLGGVAIVGAISVVEFAEELRAVEDEALKIVAGLVREWPS